MALVWRAFLLGLVLLLAMAVYGRFAPKVG